MKLDNERRAEILRMTPENRAALVDLIRRELAKIPEEIEELQRIEREMTAWLAEFGDAQEAGR